MQEFKGTRGPWVASKSDRSIGPVIRDDDQSYGMILPVAWVEFDGKPGHHQANANLIAAAPELLEVLQDTVEALKRAWNTGALPHDIILEDLAHRQIKVIAKALGQ